MNRFGVQTTQPLGPERPVEPAPRQVGRYVLLRKIGAGGHGEVYRAYDPSLDRLAAVKLLRGTGNNAALIREARLLAKVSHPAVVAAYDAGIHEGRAYLTLELVDGSHLGREPVLPPSRLLAELIEAGRGLAEAHRQQIVHGDIKPSNLLVGRDGRIRVTDFGVARLLDDANATSGGTPAYAAPEQHAGARATFGSDQYSYALTIWEALNGRYPWPWSATADTRSSATTRRLLELKREGTPAWSSPPGVSRAVERVLRRALDADPRARWPSMDAFVSALDQARTPTRRRSSFAIGAGVVALAAWWISVRESQRCSGARPELAAVWDERRADAESAVLGTEKTYAKAAWDRTERELDRYAEAWQAMHQASCEATAVRGEQSSAVMDLRMRCLHRALVQFDAVVSQLVHADDVVVRNAHQLVGGLPPLSRCADVEALSVEVEPPLADQAEAVAAVRRGLAEAQAARRAGHFDRAQQAVRTIEPIAAGLAYAPVHTEVALEAGFVDEKLGDYAAAEAKLTEVLQLAPRSRQWDALLQAAVGLVHVVGVQQTRMDEGLGYAKLAEGFAWNDAPKRADVALGRAAIFSAQGKYAEAETENRLALQLFEAAVGPEHRDVARTLNNLATTLRAQSKYDEALAEQRRSLALLVGILGPDHPDVAVVHNNLGVTLSARGEIEAAEAEVRRALAIRQAALAPGHPDTAATHSNLATVLERQRRFEDAEAEHRRALSLLIEALGPDHPNVASAHLNLGVMLDVMGRPREAEQEFRRAMTIREQKLGPRHPAVGHAVLDLGLALSAQGRFEEAEVEVRRAIEIMEESLGPDHHNIGKVYSTLANLLIERRAFDEAEAAFRHVLQIYEAVLPAEHPDLASARYDLAELLVEHGRTDEALVHAERAWTQLQGREGVEPKRASAAFVLARVLACRDGGEDRARARSLAEQAEAEFRRIDATDEVREVEAWLRHRRCRR